MVFAYGRTAKVTEMLIKSGALADANPAVFTGKVKVTVAGTMTIQFAQGTTDASNTHVGDGAFLVVQRIA